MEHDKPIVAVVGGDLRQVHLCKLLLKDGFEVRTFALESYHFPVGICACATMEEAVDGACCVIFPMPLLQQEGRLNAPLAAEFQKAEALIACIKPGTAVMAGMVTDAIREFGLRQGIVIHDYLKREELAIMNAAITAEGAIQIAMETTPHTIEGSRCLVIGYGRIGKALTRRLTALGANVTVGARRHSDFAQAKSAGALTVQTSKLEGVLQTQDVIFNTVPQMVLPREKLMFVAPQAIIIDLASNPGGADFAPV